MVSLGLDAAETDPESPLRVTEAGYRAAGRLTAALTGAAEPDDDVLVRSSRGAWSPSPEVRTNQ